MFDFVFGCLIFLGLIVIVEFIYIGDWVLIL